jgi:phage terminase large subunit-like protein
MLNFSTSGYQGDRSPDRVDALVWALSHLFVDQMSNEGFYFWAKEKAASLQPKKPPLPELVFAVGSMEWEAQQAAKEQGNS